MPPKSSNANKFKPGVSKRVLVLTAGLLWLGVGLMLDGVSYTWLRSEPIVPALIATATGFCGALVVHHFGFLKIVNKNLARILPMEGNRCLFAFMPWKSYLLILVMVSMGYLLRHSSIPRIYLSVVYISIGTALALSSIRYLRHRAIGVQSETDASGLHTSDQ